MVKSRKTFFLNHSKKEFRDEKARQKGQERELELKKPEEIEIDEFIKRDENAY